MNCEKASEKLAALHYGELGPAEAGEVRVHLAGCPVCSAELASLEKTDGLLGAWDALGGAAMPSAPETAQAVLAALRASSQASAFPWRRWIAAGMAGAVLGFAGSMLVPRTQRAPATAETAIAESLHPLPLDESIVKSLASEEER